MIRIYIDTHNSYIDTTRQPRKWEADGIEYNFVDRETFEKGVRENAFLEWAEFYGNYYGTSLAAVQQVIQTGHMACVLDMDRKGVASIKRRMGETMAETMGGRTAKEGGLDKDDDDKQVQEDRLAEKASVVEKTLVEKKSAEHRFMDKTSAEKTGLGLAEYTSLAGETLDEKTLAHPPCTCPNGEPLRVLYVFVEAPSIDVLAERLRDSGCCPQEAMPSKLDQAREEIAYAHGASPCPYDICIVNDALDVAYATLCDFIFEQVGAGNDTSAPP